MPRIKSQHSTAITEAMEWLGRKADEGVIVPKDESVTAWRRCKPGMLRQVDFALGRATVRLLSSFVYQRSLECPGGRVYHVEDIKTGRQDFVGIEFLQRLRT